MSLRASEHIFSGTTTSYTSYDSTKTTLGSLMVQKTGVENCDNYVGPFGLKIIRPTELNSAAVIYYSLIDTIDIGNSNCLVFLLEGGSASATKRVALCNFDSSAKNWSFKGYITLTFPTATLHTTRGFQVQRHLHVTGTVAVTGTAVTGTTTDFSTSRMAAGARIGFGSTDPTAITTWYYISSISSDTSITLSTTVDSTISAGTAYVVEELRIYASTTNATTTNGGLFLAKGINSDDFISSGTTIAAAISTDNVKAVYWLADASTVTNTIASGLVKDTTTNTNQDIYVSNANTSTTCSIFKYNGRAALTVASGKSTSAFVFKTGTIASTSTSVNSISMATASHGSGSGVKSMYFMNSDSIYVRRVAVSSFSNGASITENDHSNNWPPGYGDALTLNITGDNTNYYGLNTKYCSSIDRFIYVNKAPGRCMLTTYKAAPGVLVLPYLQYASDRCFGCLTYSLNKSVSNQDSPVAINTNTSTTCVAENSGVLFFNTSDGSSNGQLFAMPLASDWDYATTNAGRVITPAITTTDCVLFNKVMVNCTRSVGEEKFKLPTEPYKVYYRISGISDDSGSWTLINDSGDISAATASNSIQFMFKFRVFGNFCISSMIHSIAVTYEDGETNSHYEPTVNNSDLQNYIFAWRFKKAFGKTVPTLKVNTYDAVANTLTNTDSSVLNTYGLFEKSIDNGATWISYNSSDKVNDITYIRYSNYYLTSGTAKAILFINSA